MKGTVKTGRQARRWPRRAPRITPVGNAAPPGVPDDPPAGGIRLVELQARSCRWPLGDPSHPGFRYCGANSIAEGKPYCAAHARIAYRTPNAEDEV